MIDPAEKRQTGFSPARRCSDLALRKISLVSHQRALVRRPASTKENVTVLPSSLHDPDFLFCQPVEVIHQAVDPVVGGADFAFCHCELAKQSQN